jgi:signal transduction histidine kinase
LTRLEAGEWVPERASFDLVETLEDEVDLYATRAEQAGLELRSDLPEGACEVKLDPQFLEQIVNNLLDNALKYTEEGSIEVGLEAREEQVRIRVSDTGRGIAEEQQEAIFDQFAQLEEENGGKTAEGVGLGLAIANRLVEAMGGRIELESEVGEGTTFIVDLPRELP